MEQRVLALGFFDGVHLGHGALLRAARRAADHLGLPAEVLTFDTPPAALVTGRAVPLINTPEDRVALMRRLYGIDGVRICHFDRALMEMPWQTYVEDYLCRELGAAHLVCGHDHRFGHRGEGNPERLQALCGQLGIGCDVVPQVTLHGITVSSTHIRGLLAQGQLQEANDFLGHPHCLSGPVIHGRQLGRTLGIPTANVALPPGVLSPAFGVYASEVTVGGQAFPAVTNIGVRPTVDGGGQVLAEPWLLDFDGDLYGRSIRIDFHHFLRPERKFPSLQALQKEILKNAEQTREYFAGKA